MGQPATGSSDRGTAGPTRRPERPGDTALLFAVFRAVQGEALAGLDPALAAMLLHHQFAGQSASYRAAYPDGRFDVVEVDGRPVGRMVTDAAGAAFRLVDLALLPEWQGRGIGTRLVRAFQREAQAACMPLRLSVLGTNAGARRLYERLGFRAVETTETHVGLEWTP